MNHFKHLVILSILGATQIALSQTWTYKYKASAHGIYVVQNGSLLYSAVDAGPLALHKNSSDSASQSSIDYTYSNLFDVTVSSATAEASSNNGSVSSEAAVNGLTVKYLATGKTVLAATSLSSQTTDTAGSLATGQVTIQGLKIFGYAVTPSGAVNQKFVATVKGYGKVKIFLNAQQRAADGITLTTSAIRVVLPDGTNAYFARSTAGVLTP